MLDIAAPDPFTPLDRVQNSRLYDAGPNSFKKIYCTCGRIVDIDRGEFETKIRLHKTIECAYCRNIRIARERDELDEHYNVIPTESAD